MSYPFRSQYQYDRAPGRRRVVITGLGAVSAAGIGVKALWETVLAGKGCVRTVTRFNPMGKLAGIGGEVPEFEPAAYIDPALRPKRMARHTQFAVIAAQEALADAGISKGDFLPRRAGVIIGSAVGSGEILEELTRQLERSGIRGINPSVMATGSMQAAPVAVVGLLGTNGASAIAITNNCSSGVDAVSIASEMIRAGRYDMVITGGADAPLSEATASGIAAAGIYTKRLHDPATAVRPFDRDRDGGALGEGAGIFVLETLESARERGRRIYAEITGIGSCADANRESPSSGLETSMNYAMENAGRRPSDIDFVSAWGCGDPLLDLCETRAIKAALGEDAYRVAVSSIKGAIGIPLGAAGALQLVTTALSHRFNLLLPTVNCLNRDLDCDLDYTCGQPRRLRLRHTLHNAHGLSGGNTTLLLSSPEAG